jgi:hypothetical protein
LTWIKKIGVSAGEECVRRGLIRSAQSANFKTRLFDGGDALTSRAIDLDQCDRIAIRFAYKGKKAYPQRPGNVIVSKETKAESPFQSVNLIGYGRKRGEHHGHSNSCSYVHLIAESEARPRDTTKI